jgi:hypothetical protein
VQRLVVSKDASEREDGYRTVLAIAASKAITPAVVQDSVAEAARVAALEKVKIGAGLGTGTLSPSPPVGGKPASAEDDFATRLQRAILETPSTSVSEGLTGM